MRLTLLVGFALVLAGVTVAFAEGGDYVEPDAGDFVGNLGESSEAAKPQTAPPVPPPNPYPCHFGPITKRITQNDVSAIIVASPTIRAAWKFILARPDDPGAEPYGFGLNAPDDGLGDGLVCPSEPP